MNSIGKTGEKNFGFLMLKRQVQPYLEVNLSLLLTIDLSGQKLLESSKTLKNSDRLQMAGSSFQNMTEMLVSEVFQAFLSSVWVCFVSYAYRQNFSYG